MQIPILGSLGSNIFGPNHNMLQFGESSPVELPFDPNDIDGLIQYLFKPGTSQPYEDPATPNRWLVPDDRPGTGTGLAVDGAAVQPDGVDDNVIVTGIGTTGTSWSFSGWFKSTEAGATRYLLDHQTPRCVLAWNGSTVGQLGVFYTAWHHFGNAPTDGAWHYITFSFAGTTAKCYVDGVQLGANITVPATQLSAAATVKLFSNYQGVNYYYIGTASQIRIDDIALTLAQHTAAMSGNPTDPNYPPNATCLRYWSCEDYHNTLLLDSSGNGGHGTKTNITTGRGAGTFHYKGSDVPLDSLVARRGYTLDPTHGVIPARLTGSLDALGNSLQYTGPLKRPGQLKQSGSIKFDGIDDAVFVFDSTTVPTAFQTLGTDIVVEAWIKPVSVNLSDINNWRGGAYTICEFRVQAADSTVRVPFAFGVNNFRIRFGCSSNYATSYFAVSGNTPISANTQYKVRLVIVGNTYSMYVNDVLDISGTITAATGDRSVGTNISNLTIGCRTLDSGASGNYFDGQIWGVSIGTSSEVLAYYPCAEGAGYVLYDTVGGHNATASGITEATFRGSRQDTLHYNLLNGYSLIEHDTADSILVPYVNGSPYSGAYPSGYTLTRHNPAGAKHNGCKTLVDCTAGIASPGSANLETAWAFNTARTNPRFKRNLTSSGSPVAVDKMYAYLSALSGSDLTDVQTDTADTSA